MNKNKRPRDNNAEEQKEDVPVAKKPRIGIPEESEHQHMSIMADRRDAVLRARIQRLTSLDADALEDFRLVYINDMIRDLLANVTSPDDESRFANILSSRGITDAVQGLQQNVQGIIEGARMAQQMTHELKKTSMSSREFSVGLFLPPEIKYLFLLRGSFQDFHGIIAREPFDRAWAAIRDSLPSIPTRRSRSFRLVMNMGDADVQVMFSAEVSRLLRVNSQQVKSEMCLTSYAFFR